MATKRMILGAFLAAGFLLPASLSAYAQTAASQLEVGVVYYADGSGFKALEKEAAPQSGRSTYAAKIKGAHAARRLKSRSAPTFRVCGVDPTRYKLYVFESRGDERTLPIAKVNLLIGGSKSVLSESEVPVSIRTAGEGCFSLIPKEALEDGEFGFSPVESLDAFTFGIGDAKPARN